MKTKHLIQIVCVLVGIALLAYNVHALPTQASYPTVDTLELNETRSGSIGVDWDPVNHVQIDTNHDINRDTNQEFGTPIYAEVTNYLVYKSTGNIEENDEIYLFRTTSATDFTDGAVSENNTYFYRVRVQFSNGQYSVMGEQESLKTSRQARIELDQNEIDMYPTGTQTVNLHIEVQNDNEEHDFEIRFSDSEEELSASVDSDEFTLNSGEETDIAINVTATDQIEEGTYTISVKVTNDGLTKTLPLKVHIGDDSHITFELDSGNTFCNDAYTRQMSIEVKNNTNEDLEEVLLDIVESPLGATLNPTDMNLRRGQSKLVKVTINVDPSSNQTGNYGIVLSATPEDGSFVSYARIPFTLRNCAVSSDQSFSLTWNKPQGTWIKGNKYDVNFNIVPVGGGTQTIDINVWTSSIMPIQYGMKQYTQGNTTTKVTVSFFPQSDTIPGDLNLIITGTNGIVTKQLKVDRGLKIQELNNYTFSAVRNKVIVTEGFPSEVEFTIQNGDVDHTFSFGVSADSDLNVLPIGSVFVPKRETRTFKTLVTAKPNSNQTQFFNVTASTSGVGSQTKRVEVNVQRDTDPNYSALQVLSWNETIQMDQNDEQEVTFSLQNTSAYDMTSITVTVAGLPEGASFPSISLGGLNTGEIRNVSSMIRTGENTPNGTYELQWTINAGRFTKRVKSQLVVGEETGGNLIGTGFAFLGSNWLLGLVMLLAIVGALFVLGIIGRGSTTTIEKKEVWLVKK